MWIAAQVPEHDPLGVWADVWRTLWPWRRRGGKIPVRPPPSVRPEPAPWKSAASSSKRLHEAVYEPVELRVRLPEAVDLSDGVDHRRVVLAPELLAYLGQRGLGQRLRQVHRDLPGHRHGLRVVLRLELRELDVVVVGHELLD